jgi:Zn-dependent M28 family amino/carboxypeptidase
LSLSGCPPFFQPDLERPGEFAAGLLASFDARGPRVAGTADEATAADRIAGELRVMGYDPILQPFDYRSGAEHSQNVIAEKLGSGGGTIIVGAHLDSADIGAGVDDNASGVAVALEVARTIRMLSPTQTIRFVFFGAEEEGFLGSEHYVRTMSDEEVDETILMVNLDSLVAGDYAYVYGNEGEKGKYRERLLAMAEELHLPLITQDVGNPCYPRGTTLDASDHVPFKNRGLAFVYFESTNWTLGDKDGYTQVALEYGENGKIWHTRYDRLSYLEEHFSGRTTRRLALFSRMLKNLVLEDVSCI